MNLNLVSGQPRPQGNLRNEADLKTRLDSGANSSLLDNSFGRPSSSFLYEVRPGEQSCEE